MSSGQTSSEGLQNLLEQYAAGSLNHGMAVLVASYVTLSSDARRRLSEIESLNGVLLNEAEPVSVSPTMLKDLQDLLDETPEEEAAPAPVAAVNEDFPLPLRSFFNQPIEEAKWRFAYPGVREMTLPIGEAGEKVKLLKIKPGKAAPRHSHGGLEATLVLRGAFSDGKRLFQRGDVAVADHDVKHRPRAQGDEDCICLAVTDGGLRFAGTLAHVARDFFAR